MPLISKLSSKTKKSRHEACFINVLNALVKIVHRLTSKPETPQCDETRFSTIQPSIYVTEIRHERRQLRKNDALVACTKFGVNRPKQTKIIEQKLNF